MSNIKTCLDKISLNGMRFIFVSLVLILASQITQAAAINKEQHSSGKVYHFYVITKSNSSPYWLAVNAGAEAAAHKLGNVKITAEAPPGQTDLAQQISMVNNAVTSGADGILLAAQQAKPLSRPVADAEQKGVPVVTVDSGVSPNTADSYIATDNVAAAAALADVGAKANHGAGAYAIVTMDLTSVTGRSRFKGFRAEMKSKFPAYKYKGVQIAHDNVGKGRSQAAAYLESDPDINLIYGEDDLAAVSIAQAVKAAGKEKSVFVAGFDVDAGALALIKEHAIDASIVQMPYKMGYQGVLRLVAIKNGKSVPKSTPTAFFILTPQNVRTTKAITAIRQYIPNYAKK